MSKALRVAMMRPSGSDIGVFCMVAPNEPVPALCPFDDLGGTFRLGPELESPYVQHGLGAKPLQLTAHRCNTAILKRFAFTGTEWPPFCAYQVRRTTSVTLGTD